MVKFSSDNIVFYEFTILKILQFSSELFNNSSLLFNKIFLRITGALLKFRYLKNAVFSLLNILFWIQKLYSLQKKVLSGNLFHKIKPSNKCF